VLAGPLRQALDKYQIEATSLVVGGPGKEVWISMMATDHRMVPRETRDRALHTSKRRRTSPNSAVSLPCRRTVDSSQRIQRPGLQGNHHAMREVAGYCKHSGQNFRYETGQETLSR